MSQFSFSWLPADNLNYQLFGWLYNRMSKRCRHQFISQAMRAIANNQHKTIDFFSLATPNDKRSNLLHIACRLRHSALLAALLSHPSFAKLLPSTMKKAFLTMINRYGGDYYQPMAQTMIKAMKDYSLLNPPPLPHAAIAQHFSNQVSPTCFDDHFKRFPRCELWRFFCDKALQSSDELGFFDFEKREPGYLQAMSHALIALKRSMQAPLTPQLIKALHKAATNNVTNLSEGLRRGGFRQNMQVGFDVLLPGKSKLPANTSLRGFAQSLQSSAKYDYVFCHFKNSSQAVRLCHLSKKATAYAIEKKVWLIINSYQRAVNFAPNPTQLLLAIIDLVTRLERLHPFIDANCRTFCMLLLNRELMLHGFPPSIVEDPNQFNGFSKEELVLKIVAGFELFAACTHGKTSSHGEDTNVLLSKIADHPRGRRVTMAFNASMESLAKAGIGAPSAPLTHETPALNH